MCKRFLIRFCMGMVITSLQIACAIGAGFSIPAAQFEHFSHLDRNYFALSLKPDTVAMSAAPHDVVFLIDTSASQTGDYRSDAIGTLNSALSALASRDRAKLIAVDLHAIPLTKNFVESNGPEMKAALGKLHARVPLGSTDMEKALTAAADSYPAVSPNLRAVVYIGDGMSTAGLLDANKFQRLAARLVEARIPVSSCPVGPRVDRQLLSALAGNTGGMVVEMSPAAGRELAAAADSIVLWPQQDATWPDGFDVYPRRTPPLRADRESMVIGTCQSREPFTIEMTVASPAGPKKLSWTVRPGDSNEDASYLVRLVDWAKVDQGASLPLVDLTSLDQARRAINVGAASFSRLSREALATGRPNDAERLAEAALARDPHNPEALAVKGAVAKGHSGQGVEPVSHTTFLPGAPMSEAVARPSDGDLNLVGDGALAQAFQHNRRGIAQAIRTQVQNAVDQARSQMDEEPEGSIQNLKLTLEMARQAPDLDPEVRDQLLDVIRAALREASRRRTEVEQRRQRQAENLAAAKKRILIHEDLMRNQQKVKQLMERFDSLMDEGRYRFAEEAAAAEVQAMEADAIGPTIGKIGRSAALYARTGGYLEDAMASRVARQKGVVDMLAQVEKSHVPFPDEPPIVYPPAEVWQALSARRKEKYSSMSLASQGPAEKKIVEALESPTKMEFHESPLEDVVEYLKQYHDIEIVIDNRALGDVGAGSDTPITKSLKGISLRSALRLTLRDLDLTYMIRDEVLLITTPEEAENQLTTKVYPVADLVLPINSSLLGGYGRSGGLGGAGGFGGGGFGGGGFGGGGFGGGGFGGGGLGGGGFGGGGLGGGGLGGGGFGGGLFNMPVGVSPRLPAR